MDALMRSAARFDEFIGRSTFGRIFRLEGCHHVSYQVTGTDSAPFTNSSVQYRKKKSRIQGS